VQLLDSTENGAQQQAAGALTSLAHGNPSNQAAFAQAGAVQPLVRLLGSSSAAVQEYAAGALGNLARKPGTLSLAGAVQRRTLLKLYSVAVSHPASPPARRPAGQPAQCQQALRAAPHLEVLLMKKELKRCDLGVASCGGARR
jgi:hypothetical protein